MKVNISGIQRKIAAWTGSGGAGLSCICRNIETPMMSGQTPSMQEGRRAHGIRPNRLKTVVGIGRRKIVDPAEERLRGASRS